MKFPLSRLWSSRPRSSSTAGRTPARRQPLRCEHLEDRRLLSLFGEFRVNDLTDRDARFADNVCSANGMGVAVWERVFSSTDHDIRARLYRADGSTVGGDINVESGTFDDFDPTVAMDGQGNFVVAWTQSVNGNQNIVARRFNNIGAPLGGLITVASDSRNEFQPDVAMDANGDFVVAYTLIFGPTDRDVRVARFNSAGGFVANIAVSQASNADEDEPSVAMSPDGRFSVSFTFDLNGFSAPLADVRLQRFSAQGGSLGGALVIAGGTVEEQDSSVSMDNAGNAVVVHQSRINGDDHVFARRVTSAGQLGGVITIENIAGRQSLDPSVALRRTGGSFVVAFESVEFGPVFDDDLRITEVAANNSFIAQHVIESSAQNNSPEISIDGNNFYFATYGRSNDIFGRFGLLNTTPMAEYILMYPETITAGEYTYLVGQLTDPDPDDYQGLYIWWGDGSEDQIEYPGLEPFAYYHQYTEPGDYYVFAYWFDLSGEGNFRVLPLTVLPAGAPGGDGGAAAVLLAADSAGKRAEAPRAETHAAPSGEEAESTLDFDPVGQGVAEVVRALARDAEPVRADSMDTFFATEVLFQV